MHLPLLQCVIGFCIPRLGFALPQARNPAGPGLRCGSLVPRRCPVPTPHSTMPSYPRYRQNGDLKNERHNVQRFSDLLVLLSKWARFGFIHGWPFSDCSRERGDFQEQLQRLAVRMAASHHRAMGSIWSADCRAVVWTADNRNNRLVHTGP
jgi:hypothetical protein